MEKETNRLPVLKNYKEKKQWLKENFLKNGAWQKKKIKDYWNNLDEYDRYSFGDYATTAFGGTKMGSEINKTLRRLEYPNGMMHSIPIRITKDEFNLIIDCFAYLKEKKLISPSYRELVLALGEAFDAGYSESTIYEKIRRSKSYGQEIEDIMETFKNKL